MDNTNFVTSPAKGQLDNPPLLPPLNQAVDGKQKVSVSDFKPVTKNTLKGFFTLEIAGLKIKECSLHEREGRQWISFPGKPFTKPDGTSSFTNFVEFVTANDKFSIQREALRGLEELCAGSKQ